MKTIIWEVLFCNYIYIFSNVPDIQLLQIQCRSCHPISTQWLIQRPPSHIPAKAIVMYPVNKLTSHYHLNKSHWTYPISSPTLITVPIPITSVHSSNHLVSHPTLIPTSIPSASPIHITSHSYSIQSQSNPNPSSHPHPIHFPTHQFTSQS